jgi:hypothetical protein
VSKPIAKLTGIGETEFVRGTAKSTEYLLTEAALRACADAAVDPSTVDGVVIPNAKITAEAYVAALGIADLRFSAANFLGGAGTVAAVMAAVAAVQSDRASRVIVAAGSTQYSGRRQPG